MDRNLQPDTTIYDPTCGSGSLLLKVGDEAATKVSLYGQEKDQATSGLARMNMILHDNPTAQIEQGNTLTTPKFKEHGLIKHFDYVVANPPFSDKAWSTGLSPLADPHERFSFGVPPAKQGDYAYLLHIVRSLKSTGTGACILPHGVLFRGNAEADIRKALVRRGYIKGIIGLPANLFYGTSIPACIIVIDKKGAAGRKGIFMIDAAQGFIKDGPKNRLRAQDIHKIVDAFIRALEIPGYSRTASFEEIERNDYNLNLPRYIDSQKADDRQDIEAHLKGGVPEADIGALAPYWQVCPGLKEALFRHNRPGYLDLAVEKAAIKPTIFDHSEFSAFISTMAQHFAAWRDDNAAKLKALAEGLHPKEVIGWLSEGLLAYYATRPLIDKYDVYQHLMDYWTESMQDDCYAIAADGWKATPARIIETDKKGKVKDKGWACDLVPKPYIVARYFAEEQAAIDALNTDLEATSAALAELEEEQGGEDCAFADFEKITTKAVKGRLKEIKGDKDAAKEVAVLKQWLALSDKEGDLKKAVKEAEAKLDAAAYAKYPKLSEDEVKALVVDDKWLARIDADIHGEMDRISQALTQRVRELAERYEAPMPDLLARVTALEAKVDGHLRAMGFAW